MDQQIRGCSNGGYERRPFFCFSLVVTVAPGSWSGSHIRWGQAFRLRHLTTGHYLALTEDKGLVLQDRERSDTVATAFCFRASKVRTCTRSRGAWNSPFYLKVTCVSRGLNHSLARSLRHLWKEKKKELHRNSPVPPDWKKNQRISQDNGNYGSSESESRGG